MLYVAKYTNQILDDGKWIDIGMTDREILTDAECPGTQYFKVDTFEKLRELAKDFYGIWNENSLIFHQPKVYVRFGWSSHGVISKRFFKKLGSVEFRKVYHSYHPTMKWLVENLSADDFVQYAKDRDWNNIVISE